MDTVRSPTPAPFAPRAMVLMPSVIPTNPFQFVQDALIAEWNQTATSPEVIVLSAELYFAIRERARRDWYRYGAPWPKLSTDPNFPIVMTIPNASSGDQLPVYVIGCIPRESL